jgi:WNK lysine deficient protein kinase
MLKGAE